jgi:hypothetical protein
VDVDGYPYAAVFIRLEDLRTQLQHRKICAADCGAARTLNTLLRKQEVNVKERIQIWSKISVICTGIANFMLGGVKEHKWHTGVGQVIHEQKPAQDTDVPFEVHHHRLEQGAHIW